jgi:parvulin-like peptidyl-prolyl isomerase
MKALGTALVAFGLVAMMTSSVRAQLASGVVAIVHDSVITYQEVEMLAAPAVEAAMRQASGSREAFLKKRSQLLNEALDELIERKLILRDFEEAGYNLPESIIDENVQQKIREDYRNDRRNLIKSLQARGKTFEQYRQQIRETTIVDYLRWKNSGGEVIISPSRIERYYIEHTNNYAVEDQVQLSMIVLNKSGETNGQTRALAEEIVGKLKEGANFAEMAKVYSQGSQRYEGGKWGKATRGSLRPELAAAAFKLKPGEVSGVIEAADHYYIMLVEEVQLNHIRPLSDVRDEIEKNLLTDERARLGKQYTDKLKAKTFIRRF